MVVELSNRSVSLNRNVCARAEMALGAASVRHRPEQVLEDRGGAMPVGVGQVGRARTPGDPEMHQFSHAAGEAGADLTERVGMSQLTKQHGSELRPAGEPFGVALALMPVHQPGELVGGSISESSRNFASPVA